jgi:hypothetical protein
VLEVPRRGSLGGNTQVIVLGIARKSLFVTVAPQGRVVPAYGQA